MFAALSAVLFHFLERLFAVLGGLAGRPAFGAAEVSDNKFSFCHNGMQPTIGPLEIQSDMNRTLLTLKFKI